MIELNKKSGLFVIGVFAIGLLTYLNDKTKKGDSFDFIERIALV